MGLAVPVAVRVPLASHRHRARRARCPRSCARTACMRYDGVAIATVINKPERAPRRMAHG
jgi:hypothetical protein